MVLAFLGILVSLTDQAQFPKDAPYSDRLGFHIAMSKVREGMPASQVKKLLGTPDDIVSDHDELQGVVADQLWRYGTDRHLGFATLGEMSIVKGKAYWSGREFKPYSSLLEERQLRAILRKLGGETRGAYDRTAWLIRTANALIDLGHDRAVFAMEELERVRPWLAPANDIEPIKRLVFEVPTPPGYPPLPKPNFMVKELKPKFREDPRFPMIVVDDIPFEFNLGGTLMGSASTQSRDFDYSRYPIRAKRLHAPDDPFLSCERLIASDKWPFPEHSKDDDRFSIPYKENAGDAMWQVLSLVFDVYQPVDYRSEQPGNGLDLEKFRRGYLKVRAHWDDQLQRYVREDGVTLPEKRNAPAWKWSPPLFNHVRARVSVERAGVSDYVTIRVEADGIGEGPWLPESLRLIDAKSGKVIDWLAVVPGERSSESAYIKGPPYREQKWGNGSSFGRDVPRGRLLRIELRTRRESIAGSVFKI